MKRVYGAILRGRTFAMHTDVADDEGEPREETASSIDAG